MEKDNVMRKKILIIGATGFIGKNLAEYLSVNGKYDILIPSRKELNVLDMESVKAYFKDLYVDVVFHCAIFCAKTESDIGAIVENDLRMYYNMKNVKEHYGKMIYMGSGAEYDKSRDIMQVTEEMVDQIPKSEYGFAKYVIGQDIENSDNIYNFRVFGLFGKYEDWTSTFISGCCCKAVKGYPLSIRQNVYFDYLWVDDFCKVASWAIEHNLEYHTYNVTSGKRVSLEEIAEIVKNVSDKELECYVCQDGLAKEYTASNERLLNEIGYDYVTPIEEAVGTLYKWYEENQEIIDMKTLIYGN